MQTVRFALCSDMHYDLMPDVQKRLESVLHSAQKEQVDFIIHLGDFCYANEKNKAFMAQWNAFASPKYQVLGNHDLDHCTKQQAVDFLGMPAPYYSFDAGQLHCIVADVNHLAFANGFSDYAMGNYFAHADKLNWLTPAQLAWIEADLAHTDKQTIIFSHQSLADSVFGAKDAPRLQEIIRAENKRCNWQKVIACMNGHNHTDGVRVVDGVYYISVNSASFFYMSSDICIPRYSPEITEQYPILREIAPYKEALYAFVTITQNEICITGKDSAFEGPSPLECGHCGHAGGHPATPCIQNKRLPLRGKEESSCHQT